MALCLAVASTSISLAKSRPTTCVSMRVCDCLFVSACDDVAKSIATSAPAPKVKKPLDGV